LAVRDAAVLSCVAGDGAPNTRVGELAFVRDGTLGGGCADPNCISAGQCRGNTATLAEDGSIIIHLVHHKTQGLSGARTWTIPAGTAAASVWECLIKKAGAAWGGAGHVPFPRPVW